MCDDITSTQEELLPSGDRPDVLFNDGNKWTAVEVKTKKSNDEDIEDLWRGIFQCVKYSAVLKAMSKVESVKKAPTDSAVFLFLEKSLPDNLKEDANKLGVEVKTKN